MARSDMAPLIGRHAAYGESSSARAFKIVQACMGIASLIVFLWVSIHYLESHVNRNIMFVGLMPIVGAGSLAAILPLGFYIAFSREFSGIKSPLYPRDYAFLTRKLITSASSNNMKVSHKDL